MSYRRESKREAKKRETLKRLQTPEPKPNEFPMGEYIEPSVFQGQAFSTAGTFTLNDVQPIVGMGEYVDAPITGFGALLRTKP